MNTHPLPQDIPWFKLDNAAKIYPALKTGKDSFVFRLSCTLKETVDPEILQQALRDLRPSFPTMFVRIKHGFFWYYLENNPKDPKVRPETAFVNQRIDSAANDHFFFSVLYFQNRLSLETFHSLCDGASAEAFLKALVFRYLTLKGYPVHPENTVLTVDYVPGLADLEDSFRRYADDSGTKREPMIPAYHIKARRFFYSESRGVIVGTMSTASLLKVARAHQATITQYLVALLIDAIRRSYPEGQTPKKPIKIAVPVDMRAFFPSTTLRNFSQYIHVSVYAKSTLTFEDILAQVKRDFVSEITQDKFQKTINANVNAEKRWVVRAMPLFIKKMALSIIGTRFGERLETGTLSNLGIIKMPESVAPYIDAFDFYISTPMSVVHGVGLATYRDTTTISFLRSIYDTEVERYFFRQLAQEEIALTMQSNLWEDKA